MGRPNLWYTHDPSVRLWRGIDGVRRRQLFALARVSAGAGRRLEETKKGNEMNLIECGVLVERWTLH